MSMISERYEFANGYIGLANLDLKNLPKLIEVEGDTLLLKSEHHISLMCVKRVVELIEVEDKEALQLQIVDDFERFIGKQALTEFSLLPEFRMVERDERKSIVVMTSVSGLEDFFNVVRNKYHALEIPMQPTHITLYTLQPEAGIGIFSDAELRSDSHVIELAALERIVRA